MPKLEQSKRLPSWFKIRLTTNERSAHVRRVVTDNKLNTVCRSAACPNQAECWSAGTATFMILGNICTRGCGFCAVPKGTPENIDRDEPNRVAGAVQSLGLKYAVITSVTRDDLADGGASLFAETIRRIHELASGCRVEVLVPDFQGSQAALLTVLDAKPDVLNHNIETVPSLYHRVRPKADYRRSLDLLKEAHGYGSTTKTGLMLGLGETDDELISVMKDLRVVDCSVLTLGQYLQPGKNHLPVVKYYHPDEFSSLRESAQSMGFTNVVAGPHVRSSYHADAVGNKMG